MEHGVRVFIDFGRSEWLFCGVVAYLVKASALSESDASVVAELDNVEEDDAESSAALQKLVQKALNKEGHLQVFSRRTAPVNNFVFHRFQEERVTVNDE